jgi:hypothetical protein
VIDKEHTHSLNALLTVESPQSLIISLSFFFFSLAFVPKSESAYTSDTSDTPGQSHLIPNFACHLHFTSYPTASDPQE